MNNLNNKTKMKSDNSRRDFCKNTALVGAGMLLPGLEMTAMANVFNDKKLKIAVVGCGGRGTGAANQALKADENVELVGEFISLPSLEFSLGFQQKKKGS